MWPFEPDEPFKECGKPADIVMEMPKKPAETPLEKYMEEGKDVALLGAAYGQIKAASVGRMVHYVEEQATCKDHVGPPILRYDPGLSYNYKPFGLIKELMADPLSQDKANAVRASPGRLSDYEVQIIVK